MTQFFSRFFVLLCTTLLCLTACSPEEEQKPELTLSDLIATIPASGDTQEIEVTTNQTWTASRPSTDDWCTLAQDGKTLRISASAQTTTLSRSTTITVTAGTLIETIEVTQLGANPVLNLDVQSVALDITGAAKAVSINTNLDSWSASRPEADNWCTLTQEGSTLSISASICTVSERSTTVTVAAGGLSQSVAVTQTGGALSYEINVPTDFSECAVKKVIYNQQQIAEICLEYIRISGLVDKQMTVIYPFAEGKADLTRGVEVSTGGQIAWNTTTNTCTYTAGSAENLTKVWIEEGQVKTASTSPAIVTASITSDLLVDTRGTSSEVYRIVKIGTQYWMADNLRTERYLDGSAISTDWTNNTTGAYCYLYNNPNDNKAVVGALYNGYAVLNTAGLAPTGWKTPDNAAWTKLRTYIGTPYGTKLKSISYWNVNPGSGITGFDARPGQAYSTATSFIDTSIETWFWSTNLVYDFLTKKNSQYYARLTDASTSMVFSADSSTGSFHGQEFGHSVRCIRE